MSLHSLFHNHSLHLLRYERSPRINVVSFAKLLLLVPPANHYQISRRISLSLLNLPTRWRHDVMRCKREGKEKGEEMLKSNKLGECQTDELLCRDRKDPPPKSDQARFAFMHNWWDNGEFGWIGGQSEKIVKRIYEYNIHFGEGDDSMSRPKSPQEDWAFIGFEIMLLSSGVALLYWETFSSSSSRVKLLYTFFADSSSNYITL